MLEYETANPDQDDDGEDKAVVTPETMSATVGNGGPLSGSRGQAQTPAAERGYDSGPFLEASGARRTTRPD